MGISQLDYFILFVTSFALVGLLTPIMRSVAIKNEVFDAPASEHKTHKVPVPYLGGVAIMVGILAVSYGASLVSNFTTQTFWIASSLLLPAFVLGIIGLIDDLKNLAAWPRFLAQSIAGAITAGILVATQTVGTPTGSAFFDGIFTLFWIVGICNSINFFDNLDGGASGTIAVSAIALFILAFNGNQYLIAALSVVIIGATLGFLIWNKSPARIYMGDAGALFLGVLIASLTIRFDPEGSTQYASFATPIFLLAVPILDTSVAVISRIARGVSPFQGGRDHLSHRLMRSGFTKPQAAFSLWGLTGLFAISAIAISRFKGAQESAVVIATGVAWALLFTWFIRKPSE